MFPAQQQLCFSFRVGGVYPAYRAECLVASAVAEGQLRIPRLASRFQNEMHFDMHLWTLAMNGTG
jgi:hypothetical protein